MAETTGLLNRLSVKKDTRVRIPPSPQNKIWIFDQKCLYLQKIRQMAKIHYLHISFVTSTKNAPLKVHYGDGIFTISEGTTLSEIRQKISDTLPKEENFSSPTIMSISELDKSLYKCLTGEK